MVERKMDGGEIFIEVLNSHGVEYIIGSPGSEWPPMWGALSRQRAGVRRSGATDNHPCARLHACAND